MDRATAGTAQAAARSAEAVARGRRPPAARLGLTLWVVAFFCVALFVCLVLFVDQDRGPIEFGRSWLTAIYAVVCLVFPTAGALVVAHHPRNKVGWLLWFVGPGLALSSAASVYANLVWYSQAGAELPGAIWAAWLSQWLGIAALFVAPVFMAFLFPTGRAASRGWGIIVRAWVPVVALGILAVMLMPGRMPPFAVTNPLGVTGRFAAAVRVVDAAFEVLAVPAFLSAVAAVVVRIRRARGEERVQLKWFTYALTLVGVGFALAFSFSAAGVQFLADIGFISGLSAMVLVPVAIGVAILKYRLYDIDRIINRTLVYGALTAMIAGAYALVALASAALGTRVALFDNDLVVAGATLAVAAAFGPLRRRTQAFVDRRFYRSRYDAARTVEGFSARLRDSVELETLSADLLTTVNRTLQPAHATLWLRTETTHV